MTEEVARRTGREPICRNCKQLGVRLIDFWSPANSGLLSNTLRIRLAEYLAEVDPLQLTNWGFFVLATAVMNRKLGTQKTLTLPSLLRLEPGEVEFGDILGAVRRAARRR